ncbi:MAG: AAA family ATPase, partial [Mycobacteriales bacterium]
MLVGRAAERAALDRLLAGARAERGGGLLLCGEPGIGKTALLEYAVERAAGDLRVLRTVGVEAESTLAYAALHHLLLPVLDRAAELPAGQAAALAGALRAQASPSAAEPFAVSVAALGLLSAVAGDRAVLCVVDDAHWVDTPSLHALAFAGRRLAAEPVALLLAARAEGAGAGLGRLTGLPELPVTGLDPDEAARLLPAGLADGTRRRLIAAAGGNPLALRELPAAAPRGALAGDPLPLAGELERVFADRVRGYGGDAATVLLLAAAEGRAAPVRRAAGLLGADPAMLDSGALDAVAAVGGDGTAVEFRHPLIRSAAYQAASPAARQEAHAALAEALAGDPDQADRRAWHLAKAAGGPGSARAAEAAGALERSAGRAARRAGHLAAAAALERAAELDPAGAARRYLAAAEAAWRGGDTGWTRALLDRADATAAAGSAERFGVQQLRGALELRAGVPADALALLLPAATAAAAAGAEPRRVLWMLVMAREAAFNAGQPAAQARIGALVRRLALPAGSPDAVIARALGWYSDPEPRAPAPEPAGDGGFAERAGTFYAGPLRRPDEADGVAAGLEGLLDAGRDAAGARDDIDTLIVAGGMAWGIGRYPLARRLRAEAVARARAAGAAGTLAYALEFVLPEELARGDYATARAHAEEGHRLATETGRVNSACVHLAYLAALAGLRGDEDEAREQAARVLAGAVPRRHVHAAGIAQHALGLLALAAGRAGEALAAFDALAGGQPLPGHPSLALAFAPDAVEAA